MGIKNRTTGKVITKEYGLCDSKLSQARGLMFSKKKTLVFRFKREKIIPLHMFFVFFPIDVVFLDKDDKVVEIKKDLRPFCFYTPKNKAICLIELPKGVLSSKSVKIGDFIAIT